MRKRSLRGMLVPCDVQGLLLPTTTTGDEWMRIAQVAPLTEAVPPKLYGGTQRVVHWLTEELVALGNDVTLCQRRFQELRATPNNIAESAAPPPSRSRCQCVYPPGA